MEFKNEGRLPGQVKLDFDGKQPEMKVEPSNFSLNPEQTFKVKITLKATEPEFIRKLIEVSVEG